MRQFHQQYEEWVSLPMDRVVPPHIHSIRPGAPSADLRVVCCWDGATRRGAPSAGVMVLMNAAREVLLAKGVQFPGLVDPMVIELLTLREAIDWCLGLGFIDVRFEGDAKVIIDKIILQEASDTRVGAILEEVLHYFQSHPGLGVRFIGQKNNRVAHRVAKKALPLSPTICRVFDFQAWLLSRM
ncbi:unnamed protein product [Linum trigynum]|uniref:RNase H type-1 domain-containing protein n=1 Tax=Linum trigynum TaxID=586398 RepID=A0AAV2CIS3_9ROSI